MSRCFLLEVNKGGVEKLWLDTVNPPRFLFACLLKQPVISESEQEACGGADTGGGAEGPWHC